MGGQAIPPSKDSEKILKKDLKVHVPTHLSQKKACPLHWCMWDDIMLIFSPLKQSFILPKVFWMMQMLSDVKQVRVQIIVFLLEGFLFIFDNIIINNDKLVLLNNNDYWCKRLKFYPLLNTNKSCKCQWFLHSSGVVLFFDVIVTTGELKTSCFHSILFGKCS